MAAQPANTTISVHRRVRSFRDLPIHRTTFETFQRVTTQRMMVPGEEHLDYVATRNAATDDGVITNTAVQANEGTAQGSFANLSGLPIVRRPNASATPTLASAVAGISGIKVVRIGQDSFIEKTTANKTDDLHANLRAV